MENSNFLNKAPANFGFNSMHDIKSHSAALFNERLAWLFACLDNAAVQMNCNYSIDNILLVRSYIKQIYKNIRMLISSNPIIRSTLNLETKEDGVYVTDVHFGLIDKMIEYCQQNSWTTKRIVILINELNDLEVSIRSILQYYHYFIRPNFMQRPDIDIAVEKYKVMADKITVEQLREVVGKTHKIDFENIGEDKLKIPNTIIEEDDLDNIPEPLVDTEKDIKNTDFVNEEWNG